MPAFFTALASLLHPYRWFIAAAAIALVLLAVPGGIAVAGILWGLAVLAFWFGPGGSLGPESENRRVFAWPASLLLVAWFVACAVSVARSLT